MEQQNSPSDQLIRTLQWIWVAGFILLVLGIISWFIHLMRERVVARRCAFGCNRHPACGHSYFPNPGECGLLCILGAGCSREEGDENQT